MTIQIQSDLDKEPTFSALEALLQAGSTNASAARQFKVSKDAIRRFRKRHGLDVLSSPKRGEKPGISLDNDAGVITSAVSEGISFSGLNDPDAMLLERKLDPEQWVIDRATINEWEGPGGEGVVTTYKQAKLNIVRKKSELSLLPARTDGWKAPAAPPLDPRAPQLVVICGDQQAPFQDQRLHKTFCAWLRENQPTRGVNLGDHVDYPDISRHPDDPENVASANECNQVGYDLWRDYVVSSVGTHWTYIEGNHDERIRQYLLNRAPRLKGLKRADTSEAPGEHVHGLSHLMRLDELGVKLIEPWGTYQNEQVNLSKYLAVRHGWIAQKGSGASALQTLKQTNYSIIVGHTHRQSLVHTTGHDIDGKTATLVGVEAGAMCRIDNARDEQGRRFPSYTVLPDWQQGFATATIWPDGRFKIDLATYFDGTLLWRDQRYEVEKQS